MVSPRTFSYFLATWSCFVALFASFWSFVVFVSSQNDLLVASDNLTSSVNFRLIIDCFLLAAFFLQHSLMASASWKRLLNNHCLHRSLYVASTAFFLKILTYFWCFVPEILIWKLETTSYWFFFVVHSICWITLYGTSLLMDLSELVGLKQIYYQNLELDDPLCYKSDELFSVYAHMRHPSFSCFFILFFFRPVMTLDRFVFAVAFVVYMVLFFRVDLKDFRYQKSQCKLKWDEIRRLT